MTLFETIATLIVPFFGGGAAIKIFDRFTISKKDQNDYILLLVKQLQENVNANNIEIQSLKKEVDDWRNKYYSELDEKNKLSEELRKVTHELERFNTQYKTTT